MYVFNNFVLILTRRQNWQLVMNYTSGGEPMARVPKVARETISSGTLSVRNLPRNSGWILCFQEIAIKFKEWSCTTFQISPLWK